MFQSSVLFINEWLFAVVWYILDRFVRDSLRIGQIVDFQNVKNGSRRGVGDNMWHYV